MHKTNFSVPALVCVVFLSFQSALAKSGSIGFDIEPLVGYERVQKLIPTPHTVERITYGAAVYVGFPLISLEGEYTRGQDTEDFPLLSLSIKDTSDKAKLGVRFRLKLTGFLSAWLRAGAQANRTITETTTGGVVTLVEAPIDYAPYAGAGLRVRLSSMMSFSAGVTVVFVGFPDQWDGNEYAATAGFQIALGAKRSGRR